MAVVVGSGVVWLFAIPILAIFFLNDRPAMIDGIIEAFEPRKRPLVRELLHKVDAMLGRYIRARTILAGLSFIFYTISMLLLGFPYAFALGLIGGLLEFRPGVGWIASAAVILIIGFMTHAAWPWMAGVLALWRVLQNYITGPRIMGNSLELSPLTIFLALMIGSEVGGLAGLYLSVPAVAVLRIVWLECFSPSFTTHDSELTTHF